MRILVRSLLAGAAAIALAAPAAHALQVRLDPMGSFDFYVSDPAFGNSGYVGGDYAQVYPLYGTGYDFSGLGGPDWVDFEGDGETLLFDEGDAGGDRFSAVSPTPIWALTELSSGADCPPRGSPTTCWEVTFPGFLPGVPVTEDFTIYNDQGVSEGSMEGVVEVLGVPEPAAWTLMLVGVGAIGAVARRRRTIAVA